MKLVKKKTKWVGTASTRETHVVIPQDIPHPDKVLKDDYELDLRNEYVRIASLIRDIGTSLQKPHKLLIRTDMFLGALRRMYHAENDT